MEESEDKTLHKDDEDDAEDEKEEQRDEEQPTTSRANNNTPIQISHNMNDMKAIDFNSADEIRQAMKAVLAGKLPPQSFTEEVNHVPVFEAAHNREPIKINELVQNPTFQGVAICHKSDSNQERRSLLQTFTSEAWSSKPADLRSSTRRKRGRPPKAGPSKKIKYSTKKPRVSSMYLGKLSNVVPFRRCGCCESESESDVESVLIFY